MSAATSKPIRIDLRPGVYAEIDAGDDGDDFEIWVGVLGHGGQGLCVRVEDELASLTCGPLWPDGRWDESSEAYYELALPCDWPTAERVLDVVRTLPLQTEPDEGGVVGAVEYWRGRMAGDSVVLRHDVAELDGRVVPLESLRRRSWPPPSAHELGRDHYGRIYPAPGIFSAPSPAWCPVRRESARSATGRQTAIWYALPIEASVTTAMLTARHEPPHTHHPVARWIDDGASSGSSVSVVAVADVIGEIDEQRLPRNARSVVQVTTWSGST